MLFLEGCWSLILLAWLIPCAATSLHSLACLPASEFDPGKHSCRKQLEKHNARRRKRQQELQQQQGGGGGGAAAAAAAAAGTSPPLQRSGAAAQRGKRSRARMEDSPPTTADTSAEDATAAAVLTAVAGASGGGAAQEQGSVAEAAAGSGDRRGSRPRARPAVPLQDGDCGSADAEETEALVGATGAAVAAPVAEQQPQEEQQQLQQPPMASASGASAGSAAATSLSVPAAAPPLRLHLAPLRPPAAPPAPAARLPSPPLPLLEFDFDLKPTPYDEVFRQPQQGQQAQPGQRASDATLADELSAWLNQHLAEEAQEAQQQQQQQQLFHHQQQQRQQHAWQAAGSAPMALTSAATWPQQAQPASLQLGQGILQQQLLPLDPLLQSQQQQQQQVMPPGLGPLPGYSIAGAAGGAAPLQQHAGGSSPSTLATISVKLFGCTPAELPPGLRDHLR